MPTVEPSVGSDRETDVTKTTIAVQIVDHEYQVRCERGEVNDLIASAQELDARMREVRNGGTAFGLDRIAVIAALNIANDNLRLRQRLDALHDDVARLTGRVEDALHERQGA